MSFLKKTREDIAKEKGYEDLFAFKKGKVNFDNVPKENTYNSFISAYQAMMKSFEVDNPCCIFFENVEDLNCYARVSFKKSGRTDIFYTQDDIFFITYASNAGIILCKYTESLNPFKISTPMEDCLIKFNDTGNFQITTTDYQVLTLEPNFLNLINRGAINGLKWYVVSNPSYVISSSGTNNKPEKLNSNGSLCFSQAVRFARNYDSLCSTQYEDYILVPSYVTYSDNLTKEDEMKINTRFLDRNRYVTFTESGRAVIYQLTACDDIDNNLDNNFDNNSGNKSKERVLIYNIYLEDIYWDVYKKSDIKKFFDSTMIVK